MLIIADDLTGAADAAAPFAAAGRHTLVVLGSGRQADRADVISIDTHSRAMTEPLAAEATIAAIESSGQRRPLFVKIDSTLRGHVHAIVDAAVKACDAVGEPHSRVVVSPAFPALGRTVVDGRVRVDGAPLDGPDLRELFADFTRFELVVPDVSADADLDEIARFVDDEETSTLWVGSAGLARALARRTSAVRVEGPCRLPAARVLVVVGTRHPRTLAQVEAVGSRARVTSLDPRDAGQIAALGPSIIHADGLVLTGGYTARSVLEQLGVTSFRVGGEVEIGVPWSIAELGGREIPLVTKAGGFGDASTLLRAVDFLSQS